MADAGEGWFTPPNTPFTLQKNFGVPIGALAPSYGEPGQSGYMPANNGTTLANDLAGTVGAGALLTLCEGFADWDETAALLRVRNLDANGNVLTYNQTFYDYPNERLDLLRKYSRNPFPGNLLFEAEGCDYYGGAGGGNGKTNYFRNGNIAIQTTSDTGGGWNVGWIKSGEWLESTNVPFTTSGNMSPDLLLRVASTVSTNKVHFVIDGVTEASKTLPNTGGFQTWTTFDTGAYSATGSYHDVRIVFENANNNVNFNWWETSAPFERNVHIR